MGGSFLGSRMPVVYLSCVHVATVIYDVNIYCPLRYLFGTIHGIINKYVKYGNVSPSKLGKKG
jgi:hypothetical protein